MDYFIAMDMCNYTLLYKRNVSEKIFFAEYMDYAFFKSGGYRQLMLNALNSYN